ncbi:MAG: ABC transporter permease subunit [Pseudomonadota bacterium]
MTDIALRWYVPAEIRTLRSWLPTAAVVLAVVALGEWMRGHGDNLDGTLSVLGGLVVLRFLLPDGQQPWRYVAALVIAVILLVFGGGVVFGSQWSAWDVWSRAWLLALPALTLVWLARAPIRAWARGQCDNAAAEVGLGRNRVLEPKLASFGRHTLLLHAVAIVIIPVIWIVDVAVSPGNVLGGKIGDAFTLEHFEVVLGGDRFWLWARNSLVVAIGTTIFGLALAVPAGYAFSRYEFAGRQGAMFAFMLVQMFPGIIILVPYFMVMKTLGLLNTSIGLIIAYSVTALPLCVWMLKGFFDTVPRALEEAAVLDGCTQFEVFFRIVLPLSLPAVAITALFSFLVAWNEYLLALVFNTSADRYTLPVGLASMIPATGQQWGDFAAASLIVSIPVAVLFMVFQRALIQGLSAGSVKG